MALIKITAGLENRPATTPLTIQQQIAELRADVDALSLGFSPDTVLNENLVGPKNGANANFTTVVPFVPGSLTVYSNGQLLKETVDFIVVGQQIQLFFSPESSEQLTGSYTKL